MNLKDTLYIALIAAGYAALTILIAPIAYGPVQARVSDILLVLPFNKKFGLKAVWGLTLGTFLANIVSPYGIYDLTIGTFTSFLMALSFYASRRLIRNTKVALVTGIVLSIAEVVVLIGYVLLNVIYGVPLSVTIPGVGIGEAITVGAGGYLLATGLERKFGSDEGVRKIEAGSEGDKGQVQQ